MSSPSLRILPQVPREPTAPKPKEKVPCLKVQKNISFKLKSVGKSDLSFGTFVIKQKTGPRKTLVEDGKFSEGNDISKIVIANDASDITDPLEHAARKDECQRQQKAFQTWILRKHKVSQRLTKLSVNVDPESVKSTIVFDLVREATI
jgi:hypothetical protein